MKAIFLWVKLKEVTCVQSPLWFPSFLPLALIPRIAQEHQSCLPEVLRETQLKVPYLSRNKILIPSHTFLDRQRHHRERTGLQCFLSKIAPFRYK
jgi:hypothetical protein